MPQRHSKQVAQCISSDTEASLTDTGSTSCSSGGNKSDRDRQSKLRTDTGSTSGSSGGNKSDQDSQKSTLSKRREERKLNALDKLLSKTQLCVFHQRGACRFGRSCNFAHSVSEIRPPPDLRQTMLCKDFFEGKCNNPNCGFAHNRAELNIARKATPCSWFAMGSCRNGINCPFAHGDKEQQEYVDEQRQQRAMQSLNVQSPPVVELEQHLQQQQYNPQAQLPMPMPYANPCEPGIIPYMLQAPPECSWQKGMPAPGRNGNEDALVSSLVEVLKYSIDILQNQKLRQDELANLEPRHVSQAEDMRFVDPSQPLKVPLPQQPKGCGPNPMSRWG